jgi:hypothetical protein
MEGLALLHVVNQIQRHFPNQSPRLKRIAGLFFYLGAAFVAWCVVNALLFHGYEGPGDVTALISWSTVTVSLAAAGYLLRRRPRLTRQPVGPTPHEI